MTAKYPRQAFQIPKGPFEAGELIFRPLDLRHEDGMWQMLSDPEFTRYVPFDLATDREAQRTLYFEQIKAGERFRFHYAAEWQTPPSEKDLMAGFAMFRPTNDGNKVEAGYCVGRKFWGLGLGTRITAFLVNDLAAEAGVGRRDLIAKIDPENFASVRVAEKCGFKIRGQVVEEGRTLLILHWFP